MNYKGYTIDIKQDEDGINPRTDYDNLGVMLCFHGQYDLGDKDHGIDFDDFNGWDEIIQYLIKEKNAAVILPIYLYDHSGITINTTGFSCDWDSGQIGLIYMTKENAIENWGKKIFTKKVEEMARKCLLAEVTDYDNHLTGNCWGYVIKKDGEETESCWGYLGDEEYCLSEAKMSVDCNVRYDLKEHLKKVKTWIANRVPLQSRTPCPTY